jgi:tryptophan synthase alpha chain
MPVTRIAKTFAHRERPAYIAYVVAGDPDPDTSVAIAKELVAGGADILELGMPFSDPVADGPTIQRAGGRALAAGMTPDQLFAIIREIRSGSPVPIVIMTYFNIVYQRGVDRFYEEAAAAGADGVLIVDLPPEEAGGALAAAGRHGLDQIFLVAPTTSLTRLREIAARGTGYLYLVSVLGVTGARREVSQEVVPLIKRTRECSDLPLCIGFGISGPEQAALFADAGADGIIIGSAIVDIIEKNLGDREAIRTGVAEFSRGITGALGKK